MELEKYFPSVIVKKAVGRYGTPLYLYSEEFILENINSYKKAFAGLDILFCYALKANSNIEICRIFAANGLGADIVSAGELYGALRAGFKPGKIIFSGVGKRADELEYALNKNVLFINAESFEELLVLEKAARKTRRKARVSVRLNPDVDPHTHRFITTGKSGSKFGVSSKEAVMMYEYARDSKYLEPVGTHFHLGSQIKSGIPYGKAVLRMMSLLKKLSGRSVNLRYLDIGGGWGVDETGFMHDLSSLAGLLEKFRAKLQKFSLIAEPGRSLIAGPGILVSRVLYRKKSGGKYFIVCDAAMNDMIRPALYGAEHHIRFLEKRGGRGIRADIVGPVCESGDFLAKGIKLGLPRRGDVLYLASAGAYGFSMSSNYNSRPRPPEVLIKKSGGMSLIRKRQNIPGLFR